MRIGEFKSKEREYWIDDPKTPLPWINYISNRNGYCGIVSQTGGGFSFFQDPRTKRLTKYRYNSVPVDRPGRYIYVRDEKSGEVWSPMWQPVCRDLDSYRCRHGLGYTRVESRYSGLEHDLTYFVPVDGRHECWWLRLRNSRSEAMELSLFGYVEFTFWTESESRNQQWSAHLTRATFEDEAVRYPFIEGHPSFIRTENANYNPTRGGMAFFTWNQPVDDFETVRDSFIGPYRHEGNPVGVEAERLGNSILSGGVGCGALRRSFRLEPGEACEVVVLLGFAESGGEIGELRAGYAGGARVARELAEVVDARRTYLTTFQGQTPDAVVNGMFNTWHPYQCRTTFDWSRYISFYENGEGRGMGTRDSFQDLLGICAFDPTAVRERLAMIVESCQFENGSCYHQFYPLLKKGELHGFSDDHLWGILSFHALVQETGDASFLERKVAFADNAGRKETLYRHLVLALDYVKANLGPHGLPLILNADWNDTLHLWMEAEKPESTFVAMLYVHALRKAAELAEILGKRGDAAGFRAEADQMADLLNRECWDGEWYLRGFANGPVGTARDENGRIFLNPQSWAVISGVATPERARQCMDSVFRELDSPFGPKLLAPTFRRYDPRYGLVSRYVPGHKENGVFAHAVAWAIVAYCLNNDAERAFGAYRKITPAFRNDRADELKTEPYVYCQTISSDDALHPGEGANSWLTGTASWMYVALSQYILGVRPTLEGLTVQPVFPAAWSGFSIDRHFRGCQYKINVARDSVAGMTVNGEPYDSERPLPVIKGEIVDVNMRISSDE